MLATLITQLRAGRSLEPDQIPAAVEALVAEALAPEIKADFLIALADKGETPLEIAGFARELQQRATPLPVNAALREGPLLEVVGTGGDGLGTINLSTAAALIAAAAGLPVAKHGNRAVTSKAGSADVLEALGLPLELSPEQAAHTLETRGFVFLFAPRYHPAFKHIAPARKLCAQRGRRTLFNYLGPLLNPARPTAQLMGVPQPAWCEPLARVLQELGVRRGCVVCGSVGEQDGRPVWCDEVSPLGPTRMAVFAPGREVAVETFDPASLQLPPMCLADLQGGDAVHNAAVLRRVFSGEDRGPARHAIAVNAAVALWTAGSVESIEAGWRRVQELLDSGQVAAKLAELRT